MKTIRRFKKSWRAFVGRHPAGVCSAVAALLLFIMVSAGLSSCGSMFSGLMNGILGTSYTSEDSDLVATENNYAAKENELQQQIDNIGKTQSRGIEVTLNTRNIVTKDFFWGTTLTYAKYEDRWKERTPERPYSPYKVERYKPTRIISWQVSLS